jgi:hypothetical protein
MPNDAKLGLFLGLVIVIALSIIYRGKGPEPVPQAAMQAPRRLATNAQSDPPVAWPSLPAGEELQVGKLGGKEDSAQRVNRQPDPADQKQNEKD